MSNGRVLPDFTSLIDRAIPSRISSSFDFLGVDKDWLSLSASHFLFFVDRESIIAQSPSIDIVAFIFFLYLAIDFLMKMYLRGCFASVY